MDRILIIMKKNNGHQGIICPFTGAFFHNMQTCLLVYTYNRSQVSVYRTIGPLVLIFAQKIDCGYTLEQPRRGGSNEYPQSMFWSKNKLK